MAIWLITSHKKGIASTQLAKDIKVTQKTAWFNTHRLREAANTKSFNSPLTGVVEADETFIGGKAKNRHKDKRGKSGVTGGAGKAIVAGAAQRKGDVVARVVDVQADTLTGFCAGPSSRKSRWSLPTNGLATSICIRISLTLPSIMRRANTCAVSRTQYHRGLLVSSSSARFTASITGLA